MGDYKNFLSSKGVEKVARETFSAFAMRILDVEPVVYHEKVENRSLNKCVQDNKEQYNLDPSRKVPTISSDSYSN